MAKEQRLDIDGLKAIAILAVVFYHLFDLLKSAHFTESSLFDGGFLGVDIFFVISGFLITSSVFYKLNNNDFSLLSFYKRRFLRIVPPLVAVCIFTLVLGYFLLFPEVYKELNIEVANALLFIGNFRFANSGGYFALDSSDKLLLHTWYLAVTIQFYILFPLIVLLLRKLFSKEKLPHALTVVFILLTITSVMVSKNGKGYLLTQCRIFELFFGSLLFFVKDTAYKRVFSLKPYLPLTGEVLGIAVILVSVFTVELKNGMWTVTTSLPTMLGTALVILSHNKTSVLRFSHLTLLGRCSYSLYLWHWPLFVFALRCGYTDTVLSCSVVILLILAFTALSYRLFEQRKVNAKITVTLFLLCFVSYSYFNHHDGNNYLTCYMRSESNSDLYKIDVKDLDYIPSVTRYNERSYVTRSGYQKEAPHLFMIGDSHADHYRYYVNNINKLPVYFYVLHATLAYGKNFTSMKDTFFTDSTLRKDYFNAYTDILSKLHHGDKVILSNRWDVQYNLYMKEFSLKDTTENYKAFLKFLTEDLSYEIDKRKDLKFYLVSEGIITSKAVVNCLKLDLKDSFLSKIIDKNKCHNTQNRLGEKFTLTNEALKAFADSRDNVFYIDRNKALSLGHGFYKTYSDNGVPLFVDDNHYSAEGGNIVGKFIFDTVTNTN